MTARGKLSVEEIALAFLIGVGLTLMGIAGGVGVTFAETANEAFYGVMFWIGMFAFVAGSVLWLAVIRPWRQFDDINVPKDTGHGHGDH